MPQNNKLTTVALTQRNGTHKITSVLIGTSTQKQLHAVQVAIEGSTNQRRVSVLRELHNASTAEIPICANGGIKTLSKHVLHQNQAGIQTIHQNMNNNGVNAAKWHAQNHGHSCWPRHPKAAARSPSSH
jgi:hypothetical protein